MILSIKDEISFFDIKTKVQKWINTEVTKKHKIVSFLLQILYSDIDSVYLCGEVYDRSLTWTKSKNDR